MYPLNTRRNTALKHVLILFCLLTGVTVHAQEPAGFEKRLQDFRYSFFENFERRDTTIKLRDKVIDRIKDFISKNEADIKTYRKARLEKYLVNEFSFAAYRVDPASELPKEFATGMKGYPNDEYSDDERNTLLKYALISPDMLMGGFVSSDYMMRLQKRAMSVKEISMRFAIASPKESVIKLDEGRYQIIFDYYTVVYGAEYSTNENSLKNMKVWERKQ